MQNDKTGQVLRELNKDLESISTRAPAADPTPSGESTELTELREKLAQSEKLSNQSFEILRKQSTAIRAMRADLEEQAEKNKQLAANIAELNNVITEQNRTIARLLCLPPNASEIK